MKNTFTTPWCNSMGIGSFGFGLSKEKLETRIKTHAIMGAVFIALLALSIEIWKSMGWVVVIWVACALTTAIIGVMVMGKFFGPTVVTIDGEYYGGGGVLSLLLAIIGGGIIGPLYMLVRLVICVIDVMQFIYEGANGPYAIPKFMVSKLNKDQTARIEDAKKHMETTMSKLRSDKKLWAGKELVPFDFEKTLETTAIFIRSIDKCFQTKLIACLWTVDYRVSSERSNPITGLIYSKTDYGFWPEDLESLLELPIFSTRQIRGEGNPYTVYNTTKRIGTSHLSTFELQIIAEVVNELKNCSAAEAISYMDRPEDPGQMVGFLKREENITWLT